jgi:hypothetical protein
MNRTYDLPPETVARIDGKARELGVWQSDLVEFLVSFSLNAVDAGALVLSVRPRGYVIDREQTAA